MDWLVWGSAWMKSRGHFHQICYRIGLHLLHHLAAVRFHRALGNAELASDLFIQQTGDDQCYDIPFPRSKRPVTVSELMHLRLLGESSTASFQDLLDGCQQHFVMEGFRKELDRTRLHGTHRHGNVAVPSDEDNRH